MPDTSILHPSISRETMADIIDLTQKLHKSDNLIASSPLEFRRGDWQTGQVMMCTREESARYEAHRLEALGAPGHQHIGFVPGHVTLDDGYQYTIMGLFRHRTDESLMRRVYRLAGLMECVTNAPSAILRTDLLRRFYKSILQERDELNVVWRGNVRHFLLPLLPEHHNTDLFFQLVSDAETLKDLFDVIESEANTQFDILKARYVFYFPERL
jgi:hypothetical protein